MTYRIMNLIENINEEEEIMNILSKNTVQTITVGVMALSISSLGGLAFAVTTPADCTNAYIQASTVAGQNLSKALEGCYVNRPADSNTANCVENATKAQNNALLAALDNFQRCSPVTPVQ